MKKIIKNFKSIWEGWRNLIFPPEKLKEEIERVDNERLSICKACPKNSGGKGANITILSTCLSCGCQLQAKTACLSCECPLGKWKAEVNQEQESRIKEKLNEDTNSSQP